MYREVTMLEVKEVLRLWRDGVLTKRLAAQLGLDPKTVRRYLRAAAAAGVRATDGPVPDDQVREVLLALVPTSGRPRGEGWTQCATQGLPPNADDATPFTSELEVRANG